MSQRDHGLRGAGVGPASASLGHGVAELDGAGPSPKHSAQPGCTAAGLIPDTSFMLPAGRERKGFDWGYRDL